MAKVLSTFDRFAMESAVREHPGDTTAQAMYRDALMEAGMTLIGAKRTVTRVVREATEWKQAERVAHLLIRKGPVVEAVKRRIIEFAVLRFDLHYTIRIIPGGSRPDVHGDPRDYLGTDGKRYTRMELDNMPWVEAYFNPIERQITVGAAWVVQACGEELTQIEAQ